MKNVDKSDFPEGQDPVDLIESFEAAWNERDVEHILSFFTDDAVVRFMYPPPFPEPDTYNGKDEVRRMLEGYLAGDFHISSYEHRRSLNEMTWKYRASSDRFRKLGVEQVEGSAGAAFENGKIKHFTVSYSPESTAQIEEGLTRAGEAGPISEALTGSGTEGDRERGETPGTGPERPNRGPTWDPVGAADHQPPGEP